MLVALESAAGVLGSAVMLMGESYTGGGGEPLKKYLERTFSKEYHLLLGAGCSYQHHK